MVELGESKMLNLPSLTRTRHGKLIILVSGVFTLLLLHASGYWDLAEAYDDSSSATRAYFSGPGKFEPITLSGFANSRIPDGENCEQLRTESVLEVERSFYIHDDLVDVASSVAHPAIDYSGQRKDQSFASMVEKTWGRMSGSSVWLEKYGIFLTVSRVFFFDKGVRHWPVINFLRVQAHDKDWHHLENYTLNWHGEDFTFPSMLTVKSPYIIGGAFYGPEDPRIIMEQGVEDAEPVVVFNMISDVNTTQRAMHIMRPFSNYTTTLFIDGQEPRMAEKNWAPFFLPQQPRSKNEKIWPSNYIHFIYNFYPLQILKCHLHNGACTSVYEQKLVKAYTDTHAHEKAESVMRGGTNFEPLPFQPRPGLTSYVGFPRTHSHGGCKDKPVYRPELMILTTDGSQYYLDYSSEAMSFGSSLMEQNLWDNGCGEGQILIGNSIAKFDTRRGKDTMTVTFSVADATVQVARIKGVKALIEKLPQFLPTTRRRQTDIQWNTNVTSDVLLCSVISADKYADAVTANARGPPE